MVGLKTVFNFDIKSTCKHKENICILYNFVKIFLLLMISYAYASSIFIFHVRERLKKGMNNEIC